MRSGRCGSAEGGCREPVNWPEGCDWSSSPCRRRPPRSASTNPSGGTTRQARPTGRRGSGRLNRWSSPPKKRHASPASTPKCGGTTSKPSGDRWRSNPVHESISPRHGHRPGFRQPPPRRAGASGRGSPSGPPHRIASLCSESCGLVSRVVPRETETKSNCASLCLGWWSGRIRTKPPPAFGRIFAELRRIGRPMQQIDIQIAAIALSLGNCTVVSADSDLAAVRD